ncbi:MAG: hypothetical protein KA369_22955 [Spirochaetes bacterium]|nr:hypothetical protein [Spirochaetota bacterium]
MIKGITVKFSIVLLMAVLSPLFNLACFEKKSDNSDQTLLLLSIADSMNSTISIYNNSSYQIDLVKISLSTNSSWGSDLLLGIIYQYGSQKFRVAPGTYDVGVMDTRYTGGWMFTNIPVTTGQTTTLTCNQ